MLTKFLNFYLNMQKVKYIDNNVNRLFWKKKSKSHKKSQLIMCHFILKISENVLKKASCFHVKSFSGNLRILLWWSHHCDCALIIVTLQRWHFCAYLRSNISYNIPLLREFLLSFVIYVSQLSGDIFTLNKKKGK